MFKSKYLKYKSKYNNLKNQNQIGGIKNISVLKYSVDETKQANSDKFAGVIIVENFRNKLTLILFKNKFTGKFEEGGTTKNLSESDLRATAVRGLWEKSKNLFRLNHNLLGDNYAVRFCDSLAYLFAIISNDGKHVDKTLYYQNDTKLNPNKISSNYFETDDIARISIQRLIDDKIQGPICGDFTTGDIEGKSIIICFKTANLIKTAIQSGLITTNPETIFIKPVYLKKMENKNPREILFGTNTYLP